MREVGSHHAELSHERDVAQRDLARRMYRVRMRNIESASAWRTRYGSKCCFLACWPTVAAAAAAAAATPATAAAASVEAPCVLRHLPYRSLALLLVGSHCRVDARSVRGRPLPERLPRAVPANAAAAAASAAATAAAVVGLGRRPSPTCPLPFPTLPDRERWHSRTASRGGGRWRTSPPQYGGSCGHRCSRRRRHRRRGGRCHLRVSSG